MHTRRVLLLSALLLSGTAQAYDLDLSKTKPSVFSYNYIEGGYVIYDEQERDGIFIDGSYGVTKNYNLTAAYSNTSGSVAGNDFKVSNFALGVGYHFKWDFTNPKRSHFLVKELDVNPVAGVESTKTVVDTPFGSSSDSEGGAYAGVKMRKRFMPQAEIAAAVIYHTNFDGIFAFSMEALWEVTRDLFIRASGEHYDEDPYINFFDNDNVALSVRYQFK